MSDEIKIRKLQPLNMTARADVLVRGNPVTTRPESGVDNSYPGLEFDQRNLDKQFFPGLEFELHARPGPLLRRIKQEVFENPIDLDESDITSGVFLWGVYGTHGRDFEGDSTYFRDFSGIGGLDVWRIIHDIEPGPVALLLGSRPSSQQGGFDINGVEAFLRPIIDAEQNRIDRNDLGQFTLGVLVGQRSAYLDEAGVIDPGLYEPGDLTRSLCAPWQYDFADCGCFYWASNKPDMVAAVPGGDQIYNFQRRRRPETEPPQGGATTVAWNRDTLGHVELINDWERLPMVLDHTENNSFIPGPTVQIPQDQILPRDEIVRRLKYAATIEHGLMVEYLYAFYSVKAPRKLAEEADEIDRRLYTAAMTILSIAIDEMRHFRWVNEILGMMGEASVLDRFEAFEDLDQDGRFFRHTFSLEPLTPNRLQWFIDVERPSNLVDPDLRDDTIDGLYTRLLLSIQQGGEFDDMQARRLSHLIKLIIDEGYDHYSRFESVQRKLTGLDPSTYLQLSADPEPLPAGHESKIVEEIADQAYELVLSTLAFVFQRGDLQMGKFLEAARNAMYGLDDAADRLIREGAAPLFTLPAALPTGLTDSFIATAPAAETEAARDERLREADKAYVERNILAPIQPLLNRMASAGQSEAHQRLASGLRGRYANLRETLRRLF